MGYFLNICPEFGQDCERTCAAIGFLVLVCAVSQVLHNRCVKHEIFVVEMVRQSKLHNRVVVESATIDGWLYVRNSFYGGRREGGDVAQDVTTESFGQLVFVVVGDVGQLWFNSGSFEVALPERLHRIRKRW